MLVIACLIYKKNLTKVMVRSEARRILSQPCALPQPAFRTGRALRPSVLSVMASYLPRYLPCHVPGNREVTTRVSKYLPWCPLFSFGESLLATPAVTHPDTSFESTLNQGTR